MHFYKVSSVSTNFSTIVNNISIQFHNFDLSRCDERTFYVTIALQYEQQLAVCDLIFLVDKEVLYGAISLNNLYEHVRIFFLKHFNYELLYKDEIYIAELVSQMTNFQESFKKYAVKYPKYKNKFLIN